MVDKTVYLRIANAINTNPAIGVTQSVTATAETTNTSPITCSANAMINVVSLHNCVNYIALRAQKLVHNSKTYNKDASR